MNECRCRYCVKNNGWPKLWQIKKDLLWFEIPKNCSWSMKNKYDRQKPPAVLSPNSKIIVIWRDPVERVRSLFLHYLDRKGARYVRAKKFFANQGINIDGKSIDEKLLLFFEYFDLFDTVIEVHHFYPQSYFIDFSLNDKIEYVNIREASKRLQIGQLNRTETNYENVVFNDKHLEKIYQVYEEDYRFIRENNL